MAQEDSFFCGTCGTKLPTGWAWEQTHPICPQCEQDAQEAEEGDIDIAFLIGDETKDLDEEE